MASSNEGLSNLEIRKLGYLHKQKLGQCLDGNDCWKVLMDQIPMTLRPTRSVEKRFTYEDISVIDRAIKSGCGYSSPTELLIEEWGTMGQFRPTVQDLLDLCQEIGAFNASNYISEKILLRDPLETFSIELSDPFDYDAILEEELSSAINDDSDLFNSPMLPENTLKTHNVQFSYLFSISNGFSDERLLGRGGFSKVYLGITRRNQMKIAIKLLNADEADPETLIRQINYEIDQLPRLRHPNIIDLLGYSNDIRNKACLLYPYMPNGTLETKLRASLPTAILSGDKRYDIACGIASGLNHLHTQPKPLIHRDIKTSNILLNELCIPKIADFGLLRFGVTGGSDTFTMTQSVRGTPVYMPPEAITGDVSTKWDVWSFGVVVLELLSGLPVLDRTREDHDLFTHIRNQADETDFKINDVLDLKANWNLGRAQILYDLWLVCMSHRKKERPSMTDILSKIQNCSTA